MTVIMAMATAWTPTHPFGPTHDPEAVIPCDTKDAIARAVRLIVKHEKS